MKTKPLTAAAAVSLLMAPVTLAAQDAMADEAMAEDAASATSEADAMEQAMAMLGGMFPAEPLTPDQETRLPQAQRIITRMIPEGTLGELMGSMFDKILSPMMQVTGSPGIDTVAKGTGLSTFELSLTPEQTEELASLFDPAWAERQKREMTMFPNMMAQMMNAMEPGMRKAMAELYAINFNQQELSEIEAFFLTETGTSYARKSFTMSSDPRVISATMEAMPAIMGAIGSLEQQMAEVTADLPVKRDFSGLSPAEKARVAELTGIPVEDIEANLSGSVFTEEDGAAAAVEADAAE